MLKTIYNKKSNVDNKAANNPTDFIYSGMYLNYQGASIKESSIKLELGQLKQEVLLINYLTAPRFHLCDKYTVMPLSNENPQNVRTHNRKKVLKKVKKRLQCLEPFPYNSFEFNRFSNPCSIFNQTLQNKNGIGFNKLLPKQQRFVCSRPRFETYNMLHKKTNDRQKSGVTRESVDIIADTFVDVIDSPNDPKCKVEITGYGYKGKFNVGLDPIIDEVLYNSLQNLKENYENSKFRYDTQRIDKRRNHTLANIADNVRNYLKSKVSGKSSIRNSLSPQFSPDNLIGMTSIHRGATDIYGENNSEIICEDTDVKQRTYRHKLNRRCSPLRMISRCFLNNEKYNYKSNFHERNNPRKGKKKRNINSSGSESFEERQFIRKTKDSRTPVLESSEDSFILGETTSTEDESIRLSNTGCSTTHGENKKGPLKTRSMRNQNYCRDLSYISEKDWKAAAELLRREREGSMFSTDKSGQGKYMSLNKDEDEKSDIKQAQNNPTGNSKIVKVKETMTTTANGVTTVTQTEVIEAINQSSQCIIPSTSQESFVAMKEFNVIPMEHNATRKEESRGRLAKVPQDTPKPRILHQDVSYKKGVNHEMFSNKYKGNPRKIGYPRCLCPREFRCFEVVTEKKCLNDIFTENHSSPNPQRSHGYKDTIVCHNADLEKDKNKCCRKTGYCHCKPHIANSYPLAKEMAMTPDPEITNFDQGKLKSRKRNVSALCKAYSDPINTCVTKPNVMKCSKNVDDKIHISINTISEIERQHTPNRNEQNSQEKIFLENSGKQESKIPEEVICTESGTANIRVSLGSCDTTQRQQVYLELMEVLKHKLESENQLNNNKAPPHAATICDLEGYSSLKGFKPIPRNTTLFRKEIIEKETFGKLEETTTAMPLAAESPLQRMHIRSDTLRDFKINTKKRKCITFCNRPCFCNENNNSIASQTTAKKIIPRQVISSDSLLLKKEETSELDPIKLEDKPKNPKLINTASQTDDLIVSSSPKSSINKQSLSSSKSSINKKFLSSIKSSINKQSVISPKSSINKQSFISPKSSTNKQSTKPSENMRFSRKSSTGKSRVSRPRIKTGSLFSKSLSEKSSMQASRWRLSEPILPGNIQEQHRKSSMPETRKQEESIKSNHDEPEKKESARLSSRKESARLSSGKESTRLSSGKELTRLSSGKESTRLSSGKESNRLSSGKESTRLSSGKESNRLSSGKESTRLSSGKESTRLSSGKESTRLSSGKESILSKRGSLFVRRSTPSSVYGSAKSRQSSLVNQRVWIQNLNVPVKYEDHRAAKEGKITELSKASDLQTLKDITSVCSQSGETDSSSENSRWNQSMRRNNQDFSIALHNSQNMDLPTQETSVVYSSPKQGKEEICIAAQVKKVSHKPVVFSSMSFVPGKKSSSFIEIIKDPNSIHEAFPKSKLNPSIVFSGELTDSDDLIVFSKCAKSSVVSSDSFEKRSCSLLSFEESPSLVECVENFEHHPSILSETCNTSRNSLNSNKAFEHRVMGSKQMYGNCITTLNEKDKNSHIWPYNCDSISLQCFSEAKEAIKMVPKSLELKPCISSNLKIFRGQKNSSSESSDSKTTVILRPTVYKNHLTKRLRNFISRPTGETSDSSKSKNSSNSSKRVRSKSIETAVTSGRKSGLKSRFKKCDTRSFIRSNPSNHIKMQKLPVVETVSSYDADFYDAPNPIPPSKQIDKYPIDQSTSQKPIQGLNKDSDCSKDIAETTNSKKFKAETVNLKNHNGKAMTGKKSHLTSHYHSLNSTLCINDNDENAEVIESDDANHTTIGYDKSNVSLKNDNSKVNKRYKLREMNETSCSSTAWIVKSSDSDIETKANNAKYFRSKSVDKNQNEYLMMSTDLQESSSELLAKRKKSRKRIFVHKEHSNMNLNLTKEGRN